MQDNFYTLLAAHFPPAADACAIETQGSKYYSWADLINGSGRIANLFKSLKLKRGDRIAVQVEKSPEAVMLYLASLRAGLVFVPLNTAYQSGEIDYFIGNAKPAIVVCSPGDINWIEPIASSHAVAHVFTLGVSVKGLRKDSLLKAAAPYKDEHLCVDVASTDLAAILYTSGTTGRSKGAMLTHGNLASNAQVLKTLWGWRRNDVLLHVLPIFHVHGLFVALHGALLSGSKMIWHNKFDPDAVIAALPRATVMMGVPTMYVRLLDNAGFTSKAARNMRLFISGSAPLLKETFVQFEARLGKRILERYGMSETIMLTSNPLLGERIAGTVGPALPEVLVRVADDKGQTLPAGEVGGIQVKGPNVFAGYWQMPEKTAEEFTADGFFKTGDVGQIDIAGYVTIVGRSKDLIITGGYNVYPKEIESVIDELPGVLESAVIGLPHRDFGEAVTAVVVARGGTKLKERAIIEQLKAKIANFKVPKRIHIVAALPRNTMGKVQKNILRDQFNL